MKRNKIKDLHALATDKTAVMFLLLAMSYLIVSVLFGLLGGLQYIFPTLLKYNLDFTKTRPLHVYLAISWIFTAAQGAMYYFVPRLSKTSLIWKKGVYIHFFMQLMISVYIIGCFLLGKFGGREYLEFPPAIGIFILISWVPFAVNMIGTLKPKLQKEPVYVWSWCMGILFFFITFSEAYLWVFDFFRTNEVRDVTVQWKAMGSMVGSWNMLIYGTSMFLMNRLTNNPRAGYASMSFVFFFIGLTNLMFNWGHHTYIVPAAPWVKTVAYFISMTELILFGHIIFKWKRTLSEARKNAHLLPFRLLSYADMWIFLNLGLAIAISVPALNYYTHGTHITVAHAMGTTIGINTMLLFGSILYILSQYKPEAFATKKKMLSAGIHITNIALLFFFTSLVGSGLMKIAGKLNNESFQLIMQKSQPVFRMFTLSGAFIVIGLGILIAAAFVIALKKTNNNVGGSVKKSLPAQHVLINERDTEAVNSL